MKIEIWSDIACPFCYIGKKKLDEALADFSGKGQVDIAFKSYQLDPNAPMYTGQNYYESLAAKFGGMEQAKQMTSHVAEHAKQAGLEFDFEHMKSTNTWDAHRLIHFAKKNGKATEITEKLFHAHFTTGEDVGDMDCLLTLAEEVGLDQAEAKEVLQDAQAYAEDVTFDIDEAKQFGITGVPYFIFNRKYAISGAQPKEAFTQALEKIQEEEKGTPAFESLTADSDTDTSCADGNCAVPNQEEK